MTLRRDLLPWAHTVPVSLLAPPKEGQPDTRPYFVYDEAEAAQFYALSESERDAWQAYAVAEARAFNDENSYDKQVHLYYKWGEGMFRAWCTKRGHK